jgi:hypothetical protein
VHRKKAALKRSVNQWRNALSRRVLYNWQRGCALRRLSRLARNRRRLILLHECFVEWNGFVLRQAGSAMLSTVFKRWSMQTVLHCVQAWKRWTLLCVGSRRLARRARHTHARNVLAAWRQLSSKRGKREGGAPSITTQPASVTVPLGGRTSLRLVAVSTSPMSFQWHKDGAALAGATSAALDISSVSADSVGSYTCTVTNASGSSTSAAAGLVLMVAPVILSEPESRIVAHGQVVDFVVEATGASE